MKNKRILTTFLLLTGIVLMVNVIVERLNFRLDFTEDGRYTLNQATKSILKTLEEPITVNVYFSEDLPPHISKISRHFKEMLIEYSKYSKGMLVFDFINPNKDEKTEMEAQRAGIQPVLINVREKDQVKQQKAYMGATIQYGEQKEVLPFIESNISMEYEITSRIKKLAVKDKPGIGFIVGHGEPTLRAYSQMVDVLKIQYSPEAFVISDSLRSVDDFKVLVIVATKDSVPEQHLEKIDKFLSNGGKVILALNRVQGQLAQLYGESVNTGFERWLQKKGINIDENFVIDANCASISVRQGNFPFPVSMNFPYLPIITNFAKHPITNGLEATVFQFVSTLTFIGENTADYTPLLFTSEQSNTLKAPTQFNLEKRWQQSDFPQSNLVVAAALQGVNNNPDAKLVVFGDGDFIVNGEGEEVQELAQDNINLMVNAIDWLVGDNELAQLRTEVVTARPLKQVEQGKKTFIKFFNFLLPLLLVILIGIYRIQRNKNIRIKRMEDGYVK